MPGNKSPSLSFENHFTMLTTAILYNCCYSCCCLAIRAKLCQNELILMEKRKMEIIAADSLERDAQSLNWDCRCRRRRRCRRRCRR